jgi:WD40 repeat protein
VVFSRDGRSLATTDGDGVRIYDVQSGRVVAKNDDFTGVQLAVEFSADGKQLLAAGGDRAVLVIDATTGKTLRRSAKLSDPVFYLEASPDGRDVAVVTQNADDPQRRVPIAFTDVASGTSRSIWRSPTGVLLPGAGWTPDGQLIIVTQRSDTVHVWSIRP